ncbi:MAG: crossover junction endodeoxyribonuclease RuvC [Syntrophomonadaceae bacterium]|nr:crossover junction endodeoxyribonuclease RuvC [Syntrophomonadaceae bacterium]
MLVLGIDPGTAITGYGLVEYRKGKESLVKCGALMTPSSMEMHLRLYEINRKLALLIEDFKPDVIAIEQLFFHKNAKTAIMVAQARGVAMMTAASYGVQVAEYTPLQVKQAVAGYGNADKRQVQLMVQRILSMHQLPKPDDAADALAVAICHIHSYRLGELCKERGY